MKDETTKRTTERPEETKGQPEKEAKDGAGAFAPKEEPTPQPEVKGGF
jgi:hypothetical protein